MHTSRRSTRLRRGFCAAVVAAGVAVTGAVPAAQADLRVGQNYRLDSDANPTRGKDQVALAVNPANPQHIVATMSNYLTEKCEGTASFDGGATWSPAAEFEPPAPGVGVLPFQPTCRISNHLGESMFQSVAFGTGQNVYATSITPRNSVLPSGEEGSSTLIYKSTNGGVTWGPGVIAMPGGASGSPYYELPTLGVDPGAGTAGADRVYSVARETTGIGNSAPPCVGSCSSMRAAVSNDDGATFGAPVQVSPANVAVAGPDSASQPVISPDANHTVTIAYRTLGTAGSVQIARSADGGVTYGAPVTVTNVSAGGLSATSHTTVALSTGSSFPRLAVNKQNGNLYIVYNQGPPGPTGTYTGADHFINADSHVYFQRSLDAGATWSTPKLIGDATSKPGSQTVQTRHPNVSVAPNGRVDIVWEDRRHWYQGPGERNCVHTHIACDDARLGDTYYAFSNDNGGTFSADRRISDRSHNNDVGYDYRFGTGWAFGPQAVATSNSELLIGWMDSREGNVDNDNQDIYLSKVDHGGSPTVPKSTIDEPDPISLSVALSKHAYQGGGEAVLASTFATRRASKVVIVNQGDVAGALAGGVLARANLGPVLLSTAGGLPDSVKSEVARLSPLGAYLIGDPGALSSQVESDLEDAGVTQIKRISRVGDARTAAAIATELDRRSPAETNAGNPAFDAAVIANPGGPDAVAAAALAAARRLPILYVSTSAIPKATSDALSSLNINKTLVIGGPAQVDANVMASLPGTATRLGGSDQYATSQAIATESVARGLPSNVVYVADSANTIDPALLGAAVGRTTGIMVLSPGSATPTTAGFGLTGIDRYIAIDTTTRPGGGGVATPPPPPPPPPAAGGTPPPAASCGIPKLVKRNASTVRRRIDLRLRAACAGKMTASATTKLRVKGKLRTVRQTTSVKSLTGLNRSVRVTLSTAARLRLRETGALKVTIRVVFTPSVLSATSKKSTRTINVTVRQSKKASAKK